MGLTTRIVQEQNRKILWASMTMMTVILMTLALVTGLMVKLFLRNPLQQLLHGIDQTARGDYSYRFEHPKQKEIAAIINSIDSVTKTSKV